MAEPVTQFQNEESPAVRLKNRLLATYRDRVPGPLVMPAREARSAAMPDGLHSRLVRALRGRGVERLDSHGRAAWGRVRAGGRTGVVTPTACGKALCYNVPVLESALR